MCEQKGDDEKIFTMRYPVVFPLLPLCLHVLTLRARRIYPNKLTTAASNEQWKWNEKEIQQELSVGACDFCVCYFSTELSSPPFSRPFPSCQTLCLQQRMDPDSSAVWYWLVEHHTA